MRLNFRFLFCRDAIRLSLAFCVLTTVAVSNSVAGIMVENSATQQSSTGAGDASFTFSNFDMSGGNFLAVLYSGERSASGSDATDVEVTFDGVGITNATPLDTVENEGAQIASINYVLNPSATIGDVVVTLPVAYRGAATVLSLSGVVGLLDAATFGENLGTNSWDEQLNGTIGGSILGAAVDNTFGVGANPPTFSAGYIDTETVSLNADFIPGSSSAGLVQGYGVIGVDGLFTQTFTPGTSGGNSSRNAGAYLTLITPEPASLALVGLSAIALIGVRRRG